MAFHAGTRAHQRRANLTRANSLMKPEQPDKPRLITVELSEMLRELEFMNGHLSGPRYVRRYSQKRFTPKKNPAGWRRKRDGCSTCRSGFVSADSLCGWKSEVCASILSNPIVHSSDRRAAALEAQSDDLFSRSEGLLSGWSLTAALRYVEGRYPCGKRSRWQ
jgi:hypothetical protein